MIYRIKHDLRIKLDQVELPADYQPWSVTSVYNLNCQNFQDFDEIFWFHTGNSTQD